MEEFLRPLQMAVCLKTICNYSALMIETALSHGYLFQCQTLYLSQISVEQDFFKSLLLTG